MYTKMFSIILGNMDFKKLTFLVITFVTKFHSLA